MQNKEDKRMKKYTHSIARRLNLPRAVKARVMNDFCSSIQGRKEAGLTDEEIYTELGAPKKVAAELNEQMKEYSFVKSPWRWVFLGVSIFCGACLALGGAAALFSWLLNQSMAASVGIIGGADGPTAIFVTTSQSYGSISRLLIALFFLILGIVGFRRLSRCRRK